MTSPGADDDPASSAASKTRPAVPGDSATTIAFEECCRLLALEGFGRIVHTERALPAATPISYQLTGNQLLFRLPIRSSLAATLPGTIVAVHVDHFDRATNLGWSVLVVGEAIPWVGADPSPSGPSAEPLPAAQPVFTLREQLISGQRLAFPPGSPANMQL